jgi:hypothetical protein
VAGLCLVVEEPLRSLAPRLSLSRKARVRDDSPFSSVNRIHGRRNAHDHLADRIDTQLYAASTQQRQSLRAIARRGSRRRKPRCLLSPQTSHRIVWLRFIELCWSKNLEKQQPGGNWMGRPRTETSSDQALTCPECGRTFTRAAALGAHRRAAHGVAGASRQARSNRRVRQAVSGANPKPASSAGRQPQSRRSGASSDGRGRTRSVVIDRARLLKTLFPGGIPAKEAIIRAVNSWLDEAERLAQMK